MNQEITKSQTEAPASVSGETERVRYFTPRSDIRQTNDGAYVLEVEMPGVAKDDVDIAVENGELTITGHKQPVPRPAEAESLHREIRHGSYRRTFELDSAINSTGIQARMAEGVLTLTLPVAEAIKPRKIQITD